ncbi:transcriptional regulator [Nitratireductor mangrovi]|uniref:Transcriptional regulator n=1 Tax=Nitratireductor mangrovi TaxID=2599600 RepID=A0A5B8KTX9_9HYPH|nr:transcriptional regulator [Nitratireductor mangrovi]QDY99086.1 transcriptional regulator [Nitratireductor mangrovi]
MSAPDRISMVDKAVTAWGEPPDWVRELADLADREGQRAAAGRIGYSASTVSMVIANRYGGGDLARVEEKVRGALMGVVVDCPVLGAIGRDVCLDWQKKPFAATSSRRLQMYRACRAGCPHARIKNGVR